MADAPEKFTCCAAAGAAGLRFARKVTGGRAGQQRQSGPASSGWTGAWQHGELLRQQARCLSARCGFHPESGEA